MTRMEDIANSKGFWAVIAVAGLAALVRWGPALGRAAMNLLPWGYKAVRMVKDTHDDLEKLDEKLEAHIAVDAKSLAALQDIGLSNASKMDRMLGYMEALKDTGALKRPAGAAGTPPTKVD